MNEIQQKNLLKLVRESGAVLLNGLKELEVIILLWQYYYGRCTQELTDLRHSIMSF